MNRSEASSLRSLIRSRLLLFIEASFDELNPLVELSMNWHLEVIAEALEGCYTGEITRLIINIPPRSLKSHCVSIAFVAWLLGHRPEAQVICASYSQALSEKLARDCRTLMQSSFYTGLFKTRLSSAKSAVDDYVSTRGGFRLSTSVGGVMTGRGADLIIIDDPLKPDEAVSDVRRNSVNEWFENTVVSRLNDKRTGCIIVIMQRLHEDDLSGHLLPKGYRHISFPAIAEVDETHTIANPIHCDGTILRKEGEALHPAREPLETLTAIRQSMSSYDFAGQYQQSPAPLGGGMVKIAWFPRYKQADLPAFDFVFQSWDTANTAGELSDYSACVTFGVKKNALYVIDVFRKRLEYPDLKRAVLSRAADYGAKNVVIEDKASGTQLIQELKRDGLHAVKGYKTTLDKTMRMLTVTSTIENGFVYLPESAPWLDDFVNELVRFPLGRNDDQADALSQALDWFKSRNTGLQAMTQWLQNKRAKEDETPYSFISQNPHDY